MLQTADHVMDVATKFEATGPTYMPAQTASTPGMIALDTVVSGALIGKVFSQPNSPENKGRRLANSELFGLRTLFFFFLPLTEEMSAIVHRIVGAVKI